MKKEALRELAKQTLTVIPARYGSTRFEGKPLAMIAGKPMVQWVVERVQQSVLSEGAVVVATDDERILTAVEGFGGVACLTSSAHVSGSDRCWEVAERYPEHEYVMNVQGDEPFIEPAALEALLLKQLEHPEAMITTLVTPLFDASAAALPEEALLAEWDNPNVVKALLTASGKVLTFSRARVPYVREGLAALRSLYGDVASDWPVYRHLGLYYYQRKALAHFVALPPSRLEQLEKLEQLRAMEAGFTLVAGVVDKAPLGVDTPEDLQKLLQRLPQV
jgi:3-deoxy-manno-octulosonate cytidylyltransferase (CMP-KDO synthetase)